MTVSPLSAAQYIVDMLGAHCMTVEVTVTPHLEPGRLVAFLGPVPNAPGDVHLFASPGDMDEAAEQLAAARALWSKTAN